MQTVHDPGNFLSLLLFPQEKLLNGYKTREMRQPWHLMRFPALARKELKPFGRD